MQQTRHGEPKAKQSGATRRTLVLLTPLLAAAAPQLFPTRDVTVAYQVTPANRPAHEVEIAAQAGAAHLRITSDELPMTILVDRPAGIADLLFAPLKMYTQQKLGDSDIERTILRDATFTRAGTQHIAGLPCTEWHATSPRGTADGCLTNDGVLLAGTATSTRRGHLGDIRATRVTYAPIDQAGFTIPPDFHEISRDFAKFTGLLK